MKFEILPLPYSFKDLEPHMDEKTVELHHSKHHQSYADKLNEALEKHPELPEKSLEEILSNLDEIPADIKETVRNMGGGVYNHNLYWEILSPTPKSKPSDKLMTALEQQFESFDKFVETFSSSALGRFASGWTWLSVTQDKTLLIHSTPNHDNPLMEGLTPIMVIDVWEHAYYLLHQNRRMDFIKTWFNLLNWEVVEKKYLKAIGE